MSVLTAVAAGKLSESVVKDAIEKFALADEVNQKTIIIPGYASVITSYSIHYTKLYEIKKMGGLGRVMPLTALSFLIASLAMSGLPFLNGFISKELIYEGSVEAGFPVVFSLFGLEFTIISIFGWITSIVILITMMRAFYLMFLGTTRES